MSNKKYVIDTNVLLKNIEILNEYGNVILPIAVLEELDGLKKAEGLLGYQAREAIRAIHKSQNIEFVVKDIYDVPNIWDGQKRDNKIILASRDTGATLISNDINVLIKARAIGVDAIQYEKEQIDNTYTGFKIIDMTEDEVSLWYNDENIKTNQWDLSINQYLLIRCGGLIIDKWVWTEAGFRNLSMRKLDSVALGKVKLLDEYQMCVADSLSNNGITLIKGRAGSGKSLLTLAYAMSMIEKNKLEKLIIFSNPLNTLHSAKLGYLPGSKDEKLLDSMTGHMLSSKLGDSMEVSKLIRNNKLLLLPFSDIRGFDTTGMKALIWLVEAQNLDIELMRLAIQRVGDDCQVVIDGDYEAQIDSSAFEGNKNGMRRVSEVFRGQPFYGEVELQKIYRSKWCEWAEML